MGVKKTPAQKRKISLAMKKRWADKKRAKSLLTETEKRADEEAKASRRKLAAKKKAAAKKKVSAATKRKNNKVFKEAIRAVKTKSAGMKQVGGGHYVMHKIQPWDIVEEYGLDYWLGNVIKYVLRDKENQLEDLKKAQHYLEKKIEILGG